MLHNGIVESDWVSPPGATITDILDQNELSIELFAKQIGMTVTDAQNLIEGKIALTKSIAVELSDKLGASTEFWLARECDYRSLTTAHQNHSIKTVKDFLRAFPIGEMEKYGWIERSNNAQDKLLECFEFFGVSSLPQWKGKYQGAEAAAAYRKSAKQINCQFATIAWLRRGEVETKDDKTERWSPDVLEEIIPNLRKLTWFKDPDLFVTKVKMLLASAGVKFAVVRAPKGCTVSGAARILEGDIPHIQLSFRYLSDDQFWFSLFHEIGHLLMHYSAMPFLESKEMELDAYENEANAYAAEVIVPAENRDELHTLGSAKQPIIAFSKKIGVAPGLVVGQLQHEKLLGYNRMQHLKRRFKWS